MSYKPIVIVDYGMGNLGSILNMIKHIGGKAVISSKVEDVKNADKLILSGVGAFDNGMKSISESGLLPVLNEKVLNERTPVLGICLGMQLLTRRSEEGRLGGLGWVDGETVRFKFTKELGGLKVPHMGWNELCVKKDSRLFLGLEDNPRFYFVHSYHLVCNDRADILSTTRYGYEFVSAVQKDNIMGTQFHPEKSHRFGMHVVRNFCEMV
jgi:imidazole glycerol-phosphate synthase subunit HisH